MRYPHERYILYLISKRYSPFEIMADCTEKGFLRPSDDYLDHLFECLGDVPSSWRAELTPANTVFYRWLRNNHLLSLWKNSAESDQVFQFIRKSDLRSDFETLMLVHRDAGKVRDELSIKYSGEQIPSVEVLNTYCFYFWNIGEMSHEDIFNFLESSQEREELLPAIQGDLAATYGRLGLRQRIESEQFYDNIIALANQQIEHARRTGHTGMTGNSLMGIAALTRQALDAIRARDELHGEGVSTFDSVKEQAAQFRVRKIEASPIPSFDELQKGDVIDAEYREEDNVRQFTG